jgi:hypothetical protein
LPPEELVKAIDEKAGGDVLQYTTLVGFLHKAAVEADHQKKAYTAAEEIERFGEASVTANAHGDGEEWADEEDETDWHEQDGDEELEEDEEGEAGEDW